MPTSMFEMNTETVIINIYYSEIDKSIDWRFACVFVVCFVNRFNSIRRVGIGWWSRPYESLKIRNQWNEFRTHPGYINSFDVDTMELARPTASLD